MKMKQVPRRGRYLFAWCPMISSAIPATKPMMSSRRFRKVMRGSGMRSSSAERRPTAA